MGNNKGQQRREKRGKREREKREKRFRREKQEDKKEMGEVKSGERKKEEFMKEAEEMYERIVEWREKNEGADFDEIANEVGKERRELMGKLIGELTMQKREEVEAEETKCPKCEEETGGSHKIGTDKRKEAKRLFYSESKYRKVSECERQRRMGREI